MRIAAKHIKDWAQTKRAQGELPLLVRRLAVQTGSITQMAVPAGDFTAQQLREQWQSYIIGWWSYFSYANWRRDLHALSGWIRRHMRKYLWLRWHNRHGRRNALARLGVKGRALGVAGCRRGAWFMARHVVVNQALKTRRLDRWGFSLPWLLAG